MYTNGGCVLVATTGVIHSRLHPGASRAFAQSFVLAPQAGGFYVLSDVLRLMNTATSAVEMDGMVFGPGASDKAASSSPGGSASTSPPTTPPQEPGQMAATGGSESHDEGTPPACTSPTLAQPIALPFGGAASVANESAATPAGATALPPSMVATPAADTQAQASWPQVGFANPYGTALLKAQQSQTQSQAQARDASEVKWPPPPPVLSPPPGGGMTENASIFVRRLPLDVTNQEVYEAFSVFGNIINCVVKSAATRSFAFIDYDSAAAAAAALDARIAVGGAVVSVEEKHDRMPMRGGGARTGGGGGAYGIPGIGGGLRSMGGGPGLRGSGGGRGRNTSRGGGHQVSGAMAGYSGVPQHMMWTAPAAAAAYGSMYYQPQAPGGMMYAGGGYGPAQGGGQYAAGGGYTVHGQQLSGEQIAAMMMHSGAYGAGGGQYNSASGDEYSGGGGGTTEGDGDGDGGEEAVEAGGG